MPAVPFDVSVDFAFCPGCGNRLAAAAPASPSRAEADRRSATVLFADLSGFTTISERLDPEDVRALQTDLFGALSGVVERFDAFLEKFVGDAVMAVFGAPVAHEDDPQRALHAALEMHAAWRVLERTLARPAGPAADARTSASIPAESWPAISGRRRTPPMRSPATR